MTAPALSEPSRTVKAGAFALFIAGILAVWTIGAAYAPPVWSTP